RWLLCHGYANLTQNPDDGGRPSEPTSGMSLFKGLTELVICTKVGQPADVDVGVHVEPSR
ncbi:MAG TPA: hypothetical protein VFV92_09470, partial [Candidatus Bathyarchaeia archaeon]|nr:hypothetical protein [Candidatus Bathyarchaeia archaeon]